MTSALSLKMVSLVVLIKDSGVREIAAKRSLRISFQFKPGVPLKNYLEKQPKYNTQDHLLNIFAIQL